MTEHDGTAASVRAYTLGRTNAENLSRHVRATNTALLDCGHLPTPTDGAGTGYAYDAEGRTYCYPCSDDRERAEMAASASHLCYVSGTGARITTWPGGTLAVVTGHTISRNGWHGSEVWRWWATAPDGSRWYGANAGAGMVVNMRRIKGDR